MARLTWLVIMAAIVGALVMGVSWALAYNGVDTLLGAPPPQMGTQKTTFLWHGLPQLATHPRVWSFAFAPTLIPGASIVRIYVTPMGHIVLTEPGDLPDRLQAYRRTGY